MQCPSCEFNNMPGMAVCGRCGANLQLAAATIDVHPPRASRRAKFFRQWFPVYAWYHRLWYVLESVSIARLPRLELSQNAYGALLRMVVPGWAQFYLGQKTRGWVFLGGFLGCLLLGLGLFGSFLGNMFLGLTVSMHLSSMIDAIWLGNPEWRTRLNYLVVTAGLTIVLVYLPIVWVVGQFASPLQIQMNAAPLMPGDVVIYNPSAYSWSVPSVGDVVVYDIPPLTAAGQYAGYNANYVVQGQRIDRILAGPGQTVKISRAEILVDGKPVDWRPLNPDRMPSGVDLKVPDGSYLILPSTDPVLPVEVMARAAVVSTYHIRGRVHLLHRPLGRWSLVR